MFESKEVVDLVEKARAGDDPAFEKLYLMYEDMICGAKMATALGMSPIKSIVDEDFRSICKILFVEAVQKYDPMKSKLSTYITNYIRWGYTTKYLNERMIRVTRQPTIKLTNEVQDRTAAIPVDKVFFDTHGEKVDFVEVRLNNSEDSFVISKECLGSTLIGFLRSHSTKHADIYEKYLEGMLDKGMSHSDAIKFAMRYSDLTGLGTKKVIIDSSKYLKNLLSVYPRTNLYSNAGDENADRD